MDVEAPLKMLPVLPVPQAFSTTTPKMQKRAIDFFGKMLLKKHSRSRAKKWQRGVVLTTLCSCGKLLAKKWNCRLSGPEPRRLPRRL
jgi:hypothetical protein